MEVDALEDKLKTLMSQLQAERGVFERIVYKNKNQHRRSSYFQYLLKVRRDLRLLQSINLEELMSSCYHVINDNRPKQKVHLLESLKSTKLEVGKANFLERVLGATRLLSLMVEPIMKAASEVSILLARSFFMGFSLTVLSLLARLRVLVQQILLDFVFLFNTVSSISRKRQSIKITQAGIEVYREYYPRNSEEFVRLECEWRTDKFILHERIEKSVITCNEPDIRGDAFIGDSALKYECIKSFLGEDELDSDEADLAVTVTEGSTPLTDSMELDNQKQVEDGSTGMSQTTVENLESETERLAASISPKITEPLKPKSCAKKVAFVSVKRPAASSANAEDADRPLKRPTTDDEKKDQFYNLLIGENLKNSLF